MGVWAGRLHVCLAVVGDANTGCRYLSDTEIALPLGEFPEVELWDLMVFLVLVVSRCLCTVVCSGCATLQVHQLRSGFLFTHMAASLYVLSF